MNWSRRWELRSTSDFFYWKGMCFYFVKKIDCAMFKSQKYLFQRITFFLNTFCRNALSTYLDPLKCWLEPFGEFCKHLYDLKWTSVLEEIYIDIAFGHIKSILILYFKGRAWLCDFLCNDYCNVMPSARVSETIWTHLPIFSWRKCTTNLTYFN